MSSLYSTFSQCGWTDEFNSWIEESFSPASQQDSLGLFEFPPTTFDASPQPSLGDNSLGPPPAESGDGERVECVDPVLSALNYPPQDFLEPEYQAAYEEWLYENYYPCPPVDTTAVHEQSPTVQATAFTHTFPIPVTQLVDPSSISAYAHSSEASHSGNTSAVCSPPISPSSSGSFDTSESDRDGDYVPPLDERDQQHRRKRTQKRSKTASKPPHSVVSSPARSVSSGSRSSSSSPRARRANSYRRNAPSRNPQCEDAAAFVDKDCGFQCPASGCGYKQGNRRSPEFKRHLITHGRWMNPGKWTCCGVGIGSAHLYGLDVRQEVTAEERFRAGAYIFKGQWMIGGCMTTFSRRDALKRHIDNRNIPCVGNMKTYSF